MREQRWFDAVPLLVRALIPNLLTLAGLLFAVAGVVVGIRDGWPFLLVSSSLDMADGWSARTLDAVTEFGAQFDWHADVAIAHMLLWRCLPMETAALMSGGLSMVQAGGRGINQKWSGRSAVFVFLLLAEHLHA